MVLQPQQVGLKPFVREIALHYGSLPKKHNALLRVSIQRLSHGSASIAATHSHCLVKFLNMVVAGTVFVILAIWIKHLYNLNSLTASVMT